MSFEGWEKKTLGEIANVQTGPFGSQLHVSDYTDEGVPVIMPVNIENGNINTDKIARVDQNKADILSRHKVSENDIVFSRRGDVERHAFIKSNNVGWLCGTGCLKVSFNNSVHPRFVSYQLLLEEKKKWLRNHAVGTTMPNLNTTILSALEVALPKIDKQKRIASILSSLDDKIELNRQTNQTLEAIAQVIFKEWFIDFNFPGATGEMQDSELGEIPKGWRVGRLMDFGNVICGKTPSKANKDFFGKDIPFIKIPDMHGSVFITETEDGLSKKGALSQKNKLIPRNSVLVSCIATVGLVAITSESSQTNQQINSIVPTKDIYTYYLYFTLSGMEGLLKDLGSGGSATLNVNTSTFSNIKRIFPAAEVLQKFSNVVKPLFDQILNNLYQTKTLTQLRDSLLPKLMKGEINIQNQN